MFFSKKKTLPERSKMAGKDLNEAILNRLETRREVTEYQARMLCEAVAAGNTNFISADALEDIFDLLVFYGIYSELGNNTVSSVLKEMMESGEWDEIIANEQQVANERELLSCCKDDVCCNPNGCCKDKINTSQAEEDQIKAMNEAIAKLGESKKTDGGCTGGCHCC